VHHRTTEPNVSQHTPVITPWRWPLAEPKRIGKNDIVHVSWKNVCIIYIAYFVNPNILVNRENWHALVQVIIQHSYVVAQCCYQLGTTKYLFFTRVSHLASHIKVSPYAAGAEKRIWVWEAVNNRAPRGGGLDNEEFHHLYNSPDISRLINRRMRWVGNVARKGQVSSF
jgi:hypothetical protein